MKLSTSTTILISILLTAIVVTSQRTQCTTSRKCSECEAKDCDRDQECKTGLKCAAEHTAQLLSIGADPIKAHCRPTIGAANTELCFNPAKLLKSCTVENPCTECEPRDCDTDDQCGGNGMICADAHQAELTAAGLDPRKAYCDKDIGLSNWELCYSQYSIKEHVHPCMAVIDKSNTYSNEEMNAKWLKFRTNWPYRPFCLLQPVEDPIRDPRLFLPTTPDFAMDPHTEYVIVNRDNGDPTLASDWLGACGFTYLGVDFVSLFVDESDTMDRNTVEASLNKLGDDIYAAGMDTYCYVFDSLEDWITPFDVKLGPYYGEAMCE